MIDTNTEAVWDLTDELLSWASYLEDEADPDSDDLYTVDQIRKATAMIKRLLDERDALIKPTDEERNGPALSAYLQSFIAKGKP